MLAYSIHWHRLRVMVTCDKSYGTQHSHALKSILPCSVPVIFDLYDARVGAINATMVESSIAALAGGWSNPRRSRYTICSAPVISDAGRGCMVPRFIGLTFSSREQNESLLGCVEIIGAGICLEIPVKVHCRVNATAKDHIGV